MISIIVKYPVIEPYESFQNSSTMTLDEVLELRARYGAESEMYGSAVQNTVAKRANGTDSSMSSWKSDVKQWSKSSISNAESSVCNFSFTETDKSMYISLHTTPENTLADNTSEIDRQGLLSYGI